MLLIVIANAVVASAQAVFSVEEISYVEYADTEKEYSRYNVILKIKVQQSVRNNEKGGKR